MKIPFNKEWNFIEREDYANYLFLAVTWEGWTWMPKKWGMTNGRFLGAEFINSACNLFILKEPHDKSNKERFQLMFTKPQVWRLMQQNMIKNSIKLFKLGRRMKKLKTEKLSNKSLANWISRFQKAQAEVHVPRGCMWLLESPDNIVSRYLYHYLEERASNSGKVSQPPQQALQTLSTPLHPSIWTQEREQLIDIAKMKDRRERQRRLTAHTKKYVWLEYGLHGQALDQKYFSDQLRKILPQVRSGRIARYPEEKKRIAMLQKKLFKEYQIGRPHQNIFRIAQNSLFVRLYSKDSQFHGYYCIEPLLREIGKRIGLTLEQVLFLSPDDFSQALIKGKDFSKITKQRQKYSLFVCDGGKTGYWHGPEAKKIKKKMSFVKKVKNHGVEEILKGQTAYAGKVKGGVKIINTVQEMVKMHAGNILVSHMTNPGIVPAMKKAAAIVTNSGGITSHAAIIARELKVPCVIGTKHATEVLKDGDIVEVDATKGIVKKI